MALTEEIKAIVQWLVNHQAHVASEEHPHLYRNTAGSSGATEIPANAPKCDWRTKDATGEKTCGSQEKLFKVTHRNGIGQEKNNIVCRDHLVGKGNVWDKFADPQATPL